MVIPLALEMMKTLQVETLHLTWLRLSHRQPVDFPDDLADPQAMVSSRETREEPRDYPRFDPRPWADGYCSPDDGHGREAGWPRWKAWFVARL